MSGLFVPGAGLSVPAAFKASAARIVAAANAYTTRAVMSSPPTIALGASFGASGISGGGAAGSPNILPNDARIRKTGPTYTVTTGMTTYYGAWNTGSGNTLTDGGHGWGIGFKTNSATVEISVIFGTQPLARLRVNGQWVSASDTTLFATADYGAHLVKLTFGSTAERTIEMFLGTNGGFVGVNVVSGATFALPAASPADVTAAFFGDSYVQGNYPGVAGIRNSLAQTFFEIMGIADGVPFGTGGRGWVNAVGSQTIGSALALNAGNITAPDIVFLHGSVNDAPQPAATVQANITTGIQVAQTAYPNAWIVFFSGFNKAISGVDTAHFAAQLAGAQAAADYRTVVIDTSSYPAMSTTGYLTDGRAHDSNDGTHPGLNETAVLTGLMKTGAIGALQMRAGS